ncbi:MAG: MFS transporter [Candidatus Bathyarchaeia archaeon]
MAHNQSGSLLENVGILAGGFTALFFLSALNSAYSTVLSMIKSELSLSYALSGFLMTSYFVGYALGQIPWGFMTDRFGIKKTMTLSLAGTAMSTVFFGFAANIWQIIVSRFLAGLLGAGLFVPAVKLISVWFSSNKRGTALGVLNIGGSLGLVAISWFSPILSFSFGWRGSLILIGLSGFLSSCLAWQLLRDQTISLSENEHRLNLKETFGNKGFWALAFMQFVRLGSYYTFIAWLPIFFQEEYGLSLLAAGTAFSLFNLAGTVSNPLGGVFSDRVGEKLTIFLSFIFLALTIMIFFEINMLQIPYISAFILGWFINFVRSPIFTIIPKIWGASMAGKISGIHNTFASIGALVLPFFLGYIKDLTNSYYFGWILLSVLLILGTILNLLIRMPE